MSWTKSSDPVSVSPGVVVVSQLTKYLFCKFLTLFCTLLMYLPDQMS